MDVFITDFHPNDVRNVLRTATAVYRLLRPHHSISVLYLRLMFTCFIVKRFRWEDLEDGVSQTANMIIYPTEMGLVSIHVPSNS
jgi:hypothetical protein